MKKVIAEHIIKAAEVIGLELDLREDYSGRGMYGAETAAIVGDQSGFMQACCYAAGTIDSQEDQDPEDAFDLDEFCEAVGKLRTDNMGRSSLVWY